MEDTGTDDRHDILTRLNENAIRAIAFRAMERTANEGEIWGGILAACKRNRLLSEPYRQRQGALQSEVISTLVRMYDSPDDPRNASLGRLINTLSAEARAGRADAQAVANVQERFNRLKGDHRLQRLRTRRHQHLAHTAIEITELQTLTFGDARSFVDETLALLSELNFLVTGSRKEFASSIEFWHDLAEVFWKQFGNGGRAPT
jgi:hypothetical protein